MDLNKPLEEMSLEELQELRRQKATATAPVAQKTQEPAVEPEEHRSAAAQPPEPKATPPIGRDRFESQMSPVGEMEYQTKRAKGVISGGATAAGHLAKEVAPYLLAGATVSNPVAALGAGAALGGRIPGEIANFINPPVTVQPGPAMAGRGPIEPQVSPRLDAARAAGGEVAMLGGLMFPPTAPMAAGMMGVQSVDAMRAAQSPEELGAGVVDLAGAGLIARHQMGQMAPRVPQGAVPATNLAAQANVNRPPIDQPGYYPGAVAERLATPQDVRPQFTPEQQALRMQRLGVVEQPAPVVQTPPPMRSVPQQLRRDVAREPAPAPVVEEQRPPEMRQLSPEPEPREQRQYSPEEQEVRMQRLYPRQPERVKPHVGDPQVFRSVPQQLRRDRAPVEAHVEEAPPKRALSLERAEEPVPFLKAPPESGAAKQGEVLRYNQAREAAHRYQTTGELPQEVEQLLMEPAWQAGWLDQLEGNPYLKQR